MVQLLYYVCYAFLAANRAFAPNRPFLLPFQTFQLANDLMLSQVPVLLLRILLLLLTVIGLIQL
jgi:hypothetical protein